MRDAVQMPEATRQIAVLLVDDNPTDVRLIRELLGKCTLSTFSIEHVGRLQDGLHKARTNGFSVMLLDPSLPDSAGTDTIVKAHEAVPHLPIVVLTDLQDERTALDAIGYGADDYLFKERLDPTTLEKSINYAVSRAAMMSALRLSEERYALALQGANDGIWDWCFAAATVSYSDRWKMMLGCDHGEVSGSPEEWFGRIHPDDVKRVRSEFKEHLEGRAAHFETEYRMRHKDGTYRWILGRGLAVRDAQGVAYRIAGSHTDVSARKKAEDQLLYHAYHDRVTGLANRTLFLDRLGQAMSRAERNREHTFALIALDIDRFGTINDSYGRGAGNLLLKNLGERLAGQLRGQDTLARVGGGQFAVLVDDVGDIRRAMQVAERLQQQTQAAFRLLERDVFVNVSVGITTSGTPRERPEELLQDADIAMHRARMVGDAVPAVFDSKMHDRVLTRLQLETELRTALEKDQLFVHYQPIVAIDSRGVVGFEALLRWNHPSRGCVPAGAFISVVEETGMLPAIFRRILPMVAAQVAQWNRLPDTDRPIFVNVNLSPRQLSDPRTLQDIDDALAMHGLAEGGLGVEITESTITQDADGARTVLQAMSERGLRLDLDDFGTGYSSLSCLHSFPIDGLKIDRSFVAELSSNERQRKVCRAIVALAQTLGMRVTAEGIETPEQLQHVADLGCHQGQGWHLGMPMDAVQATELLCSRQRARQGAA